jgi:hypothetical protein
MCSIAEQQARARAVNSQCFNLQCRAKKRHDSGSWYCWRCKRKTKAVIRRQCKINASRHARSA